MNRKKAKGSSKSSYLTVSSKCPECEKGRVSYDGEEYIQSVQVTVYKCDSCDKKYL